MKVSVIGQTEDKGCSSDPYDVTKGIKTKVE